jgi:predicted nucleic acid-binding protein
MALVLDTSAILALAFADEDRTYARSIIEHIAADHGVVPTLFWFEIRNSLLVAERRKRITQTQTSTFLAKLRLLALDVDNQPSEQGVFNLARQHSLTIYDSAYLELAHRSALPLATVDNALIKAASAAGVSHWDPSSR